MRLYSKTARCRGIVLQYDIYSSWGGGDQNRPHYLQRQIDPERTTHKCNTTTDVAPGLLCSRTCVTAAQQQREGTAASCLCLSTSALCGPAPAVPAACSYLGLSAAAWARSRAQDSTPWHRQLLVRHCGTVRSPASAALPTTQHPQPHCCLRCCLGPGASHTGWARCPQRQLSPVPVVVVQSQGSCVSSAP